MDCGELVSNVHPSLSIPDLIKLIRFTFIQSEFDEVQSALMEKEKGMKLEIEEHVRDRDSLKKEIDLLEKSQSCMESQKFAAEEKLETSKRRCDELDSVIARMEDEIRALKNEKLAVEEQLKCSSSKRVELAGRLLKMKAKLKRNENLENEKTVVEEKLRCSDRKCEDMLKEIEELRREKLDANVTIAELKQREIEANKTVQDLELKNGEASKTIEKLKRNENLENEKMVVEEKLRCSDRKCEDMLKEIEELRREKLDANVTIAELKQREIEANKTVQDLELKNGEASKTIDELRSKVAALDESILRIENGLSKMLSVDTEDLPNLVKGMDACADSKENENGNGVLPEVRATCDNSAASVGVGLSQKGGITMAHPLTVPAVAERAGTVKDNEGQPGAKGPTGKTQSAGVVIVLSDSDDEEAAVGTIPGMSSGQTSKRNRTEDSPITSAAKRGKSLFGEPSRCSSFFSRREERATDATYDWRYPTLSTFTVNYEDRADSDTETHEERATDATYDSTYPTLSTFTVNYEDRADSDTETCSKDTHMMNYVATSFKK